MMESLVLLAQEFEGGDAAGGLLGFLCMIVAVCAISAVLLWGVFKKAGVTPWWSAAPIPIAEDFDAYANGEVAGIFTVTGARSASSSTSMVPSVV